MPNAGIRAIASDRRVHLGDEVSVINGRVAVAACVTAKPVGC
jgi:hypothetical protein